jgi:hypothetical protein
MPCLRQAGLCSLPAPISSGLSPGSDACTLGVAENASGFQQVAEKTPAHIVQSPSPRVILSGALYLLAQGGAKNLLRKSRLLPLTRLTTLATLSPGVCVRTGEGRAFSVWCQDILYSICQDMLYS